MGTWIKCSERLPEVGAEVLIRIPVCGHWNVELGYYRGGGVWYGGWCSSHGVGHCYKVTQWADTPQEPT